MNIPDSVSNLTCRFRILNLKLNSFRTNSALDWAPTFPDTDTPFEVHLGNSRAALYRVHNYDAVIKESNNRSCLVTYYIELQHRDRFLGPRDDLSCLYGFTELMSFATRNTVCCDGFEYLDNNGMRHFAHEQGTYVRAMKQNGDRIPQHYTSGSNQALDFLELCISDYLEKYRLAGFLQLIRLLAHSEYELSSELRFLHVWLAATRLVAAAEKLKMFQRHKEIPLSHTLGSKAIEILRTSGKFDEQDMSRLKGKLDELDNPGELEKFITLCQLYGVPEPECKLIRTIRNRLVHGFSPAVHERGDIRRQRRLLEDTIVRLTLSVLGFTGSFISCFPTYHEVDSCHDGSSASD